MHQLVCLMALRLSGLRDDTDNGNARPDKAFTPPSGMMTFA
ncbi:hypothetical protein J2T25_003725 [Citrobacter amalonaticus]|nr:hypothetical protein [Citrobacter amalonaticus]